MFPATKPKVLVTGVTGFVASHITKRLLRTSELFVKFVVLLSGIFNFPSLMVCVNLITCALFPFFGPIFICFPQEIFTENGSCTQLLSDEKHCFRQIHSTRHSQK